MKTAVRAICSCYSVLLILYPRRLRDSYGWEMVEVFRQQLLDSFETAGMTGALRTTAGAMGELVTIGIPSRLKSEVLAVFALAVSISLTMFYTLWVILYDPDVLDPLMRRLGLYCH